MAVSAKQYDQLVKRVAGKSSKTVDTSQATASRSHQIIIGIDPSLRGTGYGLIRQVGEQAEVLDHGMIKCPSSWKVSRCLAHINDLLRESILKHQPTACAIEGLFYAQNYRTALVMGEARGAALVAAASFGLDIFELAPRKVKQAIVGYGNAQKLAVAKMVQRMLKLDEVPQADAADALALALAFSQESRRRIGSLPKQI
jgi:crossover junction endodeoxyribonuclease RuvC